MDTPPFHMRLKRAFHLSKAGSMYRRAVDAYQTWNWHQGRRKESTPAPVKAKVILEYARVYQTEVFIETGTYLGDTLRAVRRHFRSLYSIELDASLGAHAQAAFANHPEIRVLVGDSGERLTSLLEGIWEPCLFWLDAHYSGGITVRGVETTPVLAEVQAIAEHFVRNHVILIDDARLFDGTGGYPTVEIIATMLQDSKSRWRVNVRDDIIRVTPWGAEHQS